MKFLKKSAPFFLALSFVVLPLSVGTLFAQQDDDDIIVDVGDGAQQPVEDGSTRLTNPLQNITTLDAFVKKSVDVVFALAVPILALFFIWAGFQFVAAQGNSTKIQAAKTTFVNTLLGAVVLLGAWVIAEAIKGTVAAIRG